MSLDTSKAILDIPPDLRYRLDTAVATSVENRDMALVAAWPMVVLEEGFFCCLRATGRLELEGVGIRLHGFPQTD
jgi:hypothetical protein